MFLTRDHVCERLRLTLRTSYRIVGTSYGKFISSDDVLELLNDCRVKVEYAKFLPDDLLTPDEMAEELGCDMVSGKDLLTWTHRTRPAAIPPHYRLNSHTVRFPKRAFLAWMKERAKLRRG